MKALTAAVLAASFGLAADTRFEISQPETAHAGPLTGRAFVTIPRTLQAGGGEREPRLQIGRAGAPLFGRDFEKRAPGFPPLLVAAFQHTPYFDDACAVNPVDVGPYGDAILRELIPVIGGGRESQRSARGKVALLMGGHIMAHMPAGTGADWWKQ